jgi:hypothetical protein
VTLGALRSNSFDERGLLGLACHPDVQQDGRFHPYMSISDARRLAAVHPRPKR